ncbi:CPBP family intramembrane glutamic endopeptidase [Cerasicoccus maritimus]|uniref:CPBP family intramembrane glutamic endopeptidase n=1 Tax=Cerasicoccus maritimus TaxID=490089 RepID=UPI0028525AF5|nr:type II CAAX endopeptidase family protein [Cerasicoccus maritimus]
MQTATLSDDKHRKLATLLLIGYLPFYLNGFYNPILQHTQWAFWAADIAIWIILPAALFTWGRRHDLYRWPEIGFNQQVGFGGPRWAFPILLVIATPILFYLEKMSFTIAMDLAPPKPQEFSFGNEVQRQPSALVRLVKLIYFAFTAGFVEEIYMRGMMRRLFREDGAGPALFIILSTLIFTFAHWENGAYGLTIAFMWGLMAAVFYEITRNLWPLILAHILVDLVAFS